MKLNISDDVISIDPGSKELGFYSNFAGFGEIRTKKADHLEMVRTIKPLLDQATIIVCESNTGNFISWTVIKLIGILEWLYPSIIWVHPQTWKSRLKKKFPHLTLKSKKDFFSLAKDLGYTGQKGDKGHSSDAFLIYYYWKEFGWQK